MRKVRADVQLLACEDRPAPIDAHVAVESRGTGQGQAGDVPISRRAGVAVFARLRGVPEIEVGRIRETEREPHLQALEGRVHAVDLEALRAHLRHVAGRRRIGRRRRDARRDVLRGRICVENANGLLVVADIAAVDVGVQHKLAAQQLSLDADLERPRFFGFHRIRQAVRDLRDAGLLAVLPRDVAVNVVAEAPARAYDERGLRVLKRRSVDIVEHDADRRAANGLRIGHLALLLRRQAGVGAARNGRGRNSEVLERHQIGQRELPRRVARV